MITRFRNKRLSTKKDAFKLHLSENKKDKKILFYILSGYKENLYEIVFGRIKKYFDLDADVCLITSGKFDQKIFDYAKANGWCYLSTKNNNLCLAQNATIFAFPNAEMIFKMDEDMFVTKGVFNTLLKTYELAEKNKIKVSFVGPLINLNGYGAIKYLDLMNKRADAEKQFGPLKMTIKPEAPIYTYEFAKYAWNADGNFVSLDFGNEILQSQPFAYDICHINFSVGLILFNRKIWKKIGYFGVYLSSNGMGLDEFEINKYPMLFGYKRIVSLNTVCGHFAYSGTNKKMTELLHQRPELFNGK